jgi:hypothetical protein
MSDVYDVYQDVMSYHYVEGIIYQALFNNNPRKRENCNKKEGGDSKNMTEIEITKEAGAKLTTLAECLDLDNESMVINELFYKFVLEQEPDKRRMIMSVYQMNIMNSVREHR